MKNIAVALTFALMSMSSAFATPTSDAQAHFAAIGSGDIDALMHGYAGSARLNWIGGPLDGTYTSADAIRATWEKFGKAAGPLKVTVDKLTESANPKGATVSANVQFLGKMPIKVRYVLTYRDGMLINETWQIDPGLTFDGGN
jgi:hypothetical protein